MKKHITFFAAITCLSCLLVINKANAQVFSFLAGSGTGIDPYQITNVSDLQNFANIVRDDGNATIGQYFKLMNDINLQGITWYPIGRKTGSTWHFFQGNFDGNNKIIRNLTCKNLTIDEGAGFFYGICDAVVENLGIENCDIEWWGHIGGLVAYADRSYISNCYVTGNLKGSNHSYNGVGGLVGFCSCVEITNCYFSGNMNTASPDCAGGLVGVYSGACKALGDNNNYYYYSSTISDCYVAGKIQGLSYTVGGLVGNNSDGTIRNCVVALDSLISQNGNDINRIVGFQNPYGYIACTLQNNYALNTMVVQGGNGITSGLNTEDGMSIPIDSLKSFTFYNNGINWYATPWDIDTSSSTWKICDGQDLPFLRWQGIVCYYDITSSAGANGGISPLGTSSVVENTNKTFIFTPNTCYETDSLWIDGVYSADSIAKGSYTFNNTTKNHTIKVNFKKKEYLTKIVDSTCSNTPYMFGYQVLTSSGTYRRTEKTYYWCDSVIELTLTVNPVRFTQINDTICEGDIYDFHGKSLSLADIYYDTLQTIHNCDSVIELILTVVRQRFTQINDTICEGDIYDFHGKSLSLADIYYDTLQTINGCDSIIELTLTVTTDVGVKQLRITNYELRVYPNPAKNQLQITNYELRENTYIQIYSVVGQLVYQISNLPNQQQISKSTNKQINNITIDISHLEKGMYFLKVGNRVARFVKE